MAAKVRWSGGVRPFSPQNGLAAAGEDYTAFEDDLTGDNSGVGLEPYDIGESSMATGVYPWFNPKSETHGSAKGDDTTNDATPLQAAITAAEASGGEVLIPAGTYLTDTRLVVDSETVTITGQGRGVTVLKAETASAIASVLHIGKTDSSTSTIKHVLIQNLTIDGNSTAVLGLYLYNASSVTLFNVEIENTTSHGIDGASSTALENALCEKNSLINVEVHNTGGDAVRWNAQRESSIVDLHMQDITGNGLNFVPYTEGTSPSLHSVSVYHQATNIRAFNIGGDALICDTMQRSQIMGITCDTVTGVGVRLKTSGPDNAVALGSNSVTMTGATLRYCDGGYIIMDEGATVDRFKAVGTTILGAPGGPDDVFGIHLRGARYVQLIGTEVFAVSSTGIKIENGTPAGSATDALDITIAGVQILQCGTAGSTEAHGISVQDATTNVRITNGRLGNSQTTGSNYEINLGASVSDVSVSDVQGSPSGGSGNFWGIASGAENEVSWSNVRVGASGTFETTVAVPGANSDITISPTDTTLLTGSSVSVDTIVPLRKGARVWVENSDTGTITLNHAAGGSGQILFRGGSNVALAANRGVMLISRGSFWSCEV